jgi:hypothetical protein
MKTSKITVNTYSTKVDFSNLLETENLISFIHHESLNGYKPYKVEKITEKESEYIIHFIKY